MENGKSRKVSKIPVKVIRFRECPDEIRKILLEENGGKNWLIKEFSGEEKILSTHEACEKCYGDGKCCASGTSPGSCVKPGLYGFWYVINKTSQPVLIASLGIKSELIWVRTINSWVARDENVGVVKEISSALNNKQINVVIERTVVEVEYNPNQENPYEIIHEKIV